MKKLVTIIKIGKILFQFFRQKPFRNTSLEIESNLRYKINVSSTKQIRASFIFRQPLLVVPVG